MLDTLKTFHQLEDHAKAKIAEAEAEAAIAARHIAVLAPALNEVEQAAYAEFLKLRAAAIEKLAAAVKPAAKA